MMVGDVFSMPCIECGHQDEWLVVSYDKDVEYMDGTLGMFECVCTKACCSIMEGVRWQKKDQDDKDPYHNTTTLYRYDPELDENICLEIKSTFRKEYGK
jgi:hypothetical protein